MKQTNIINILTHADTVNMLNPSREWLLSSESDVLGNGVVRNFYDLGNPVGWFNTKYNSSGWVLYNPSKYDCDLLMNQGMSTSGIFRYCADDGHLGLIKISLVKSIDVFTLEKTWSAKMYWFDTIGYGDSDNICFETKASPFTTLNIVNEENKK